MDTSQVHSLEELVSYVSALANEMASKTARSLEEYLRALWQLLRQAEGDEISFSKFSQALHDAFFADPLPFDEEWLQYTPSIELITTRPRDLTFPSPGDLKSDSGRTASFALFLTMICYQIADLHRMAETGQLNSKYRYYGLTSPTGYSWYNFDPLSYLKCAAAGLKDHCLHTDASWDVFALFLWLGQLYE
jgi:hypothetical protein